MGLRQIKRSVTARDARARASRFKNTWTQIDVSTVSMNWHYFNDVYAGNRCNGRACPSVRAVVRVQSNCGWAVCRVNHMTSLRCAMLVQCPKRLYDTPPGRVRRSQAHVHGGAARSNFKGKVDAAKRQFDVPITWDSRLLDFCRLLKQMQISHRHMTTHCLAREERTRKLRVSGAAW